MTKPVRSNTEVPKRNRRGHPDHVPTAETCAQVQALCGFGLDQKSVAGYIGISVPTLRKHYNDRMRKARPTLMAMAAGGLFDALQKKEAWAVKWLHATLGKKYGWTERPEIVFPPDVFANADPSKLSAAQWQTFVDLLMVMGVDLMDHGGSSMGASNPRLIEHSG